jgi:AraC family transcriptional regulator, regulatory protein of adaptative response / methylated-DNA-[protein]-cysteine methyltransferase
MNKLPPIAEMERAYLQGDASYNGVFYLGVRTTAIFCRPICPARKPLPKNVEYFATAQEALFAGYRPCKRCRPLQDDDQPEWAARLISDVEREANARITEGDLRKRGVDPATVRRYFSRRYGMTFQAFTRARRLTGAFQKIRNGATLDDAAFASGYESTSGFREAFEKTFGVSPGRRQQGPGVLLSWIKSPLGPLVAGATGDGVCLLEFSDRRMLETQFATLQRRFAGPLVPGKHDHLTALETQLAEYFAGMRKEFTVPLVYPGTPFQQIVWKELLAIPFGQTRSYEDLAAAVGVPKAVRAVGTANGKNRIAIVIPCHRVVRKSGQLGGYGGGLRRKQFLLDLERGNAAR